MSWINGESLPLIFKETLYLLGDEVNEVEQSVIMESKIAEKSDAKVEPSASNSQEQEIKSEIKKEVVLDERLLVITEPLDDTSRRTLDKLIQAIKLTSS